MVHRFREDGLVPHPTGEQAEGTHYNLRAEAWFCLLLRAASQTLRFARAFCNFTTLRCALIVGRLNRGSVGRISSNPDIIIATPGAWRTI